MSVVTWCAFPATGCTFQLHKYCISANLQGMFMAIKTCLCKNLSWLASLGLHTMYVAREACLRVILALF